MRSVERNVSDDFDRDSNLNLAFNSARAVGGRFNQNTCTLKLLKSGTSDAAFYFVWECLKVGLHKEVLDHVPPEIPS